MIYRKAYTSIEDLPLKNFVKTITTDNLNHLLADNRVYLPKPNLNKIWEDIFNQYIERSEDQKSKHVFNLIKNIHLIGNYMNISSQAINFLSNVPDVSKFKDTHAVLRSILQVRCKFDNDTFAFDLKTCLGSFKRLKLKYDELLTEYNQMQSNEKEKVSEADFTEQIVRLEKIHKISIDDSKISVSKYISYVKQAQEADNG